MREHKPLPHLGGDDCAESVADIRKTVYPVIFEKSYLIGRTIGSYEQIFAADESRESVQRAVRIAPGRHEALVELVREIAVQRGARRPEDLISQEPTCHKVSVRSEGRSRRAG
jgi:hypothetical protein